MSEGLNYLAPEFWHMVGAALICGGLVGLERQLRGKPAGIRTSVLICLGSAVFVRIGVVLQGDSADPTRVVGQVVTGIGFLGAGVILTRGGLVVGVTSAAVVWTLAAVGAVIGIGLTGTAVALAGVMVGVLWGVQLLERAFRALRRGVHGDGEESEDAPRAPHLPDGRP